MTFGSSISSARLRIGSVSFLNAKPLIYGLETDGSLELTLDVPAKLLIGDKVVCEEPKELPYQLDLGEAWKRMTGLPFVFAAWMAREEVELGDLPQRLEQAKRAGLVHVDQIIRQHAMPRGWPPEIAR